MEEQSITGSVDGVKVGSCATQLLITNVDRVNEVGSQDEVFNRAISLRLEHRDAVILERVVPSISESRFVELETPTKSLMQGK